eukprot:381032_1
MEKSVLNTTILVETEPLSTPQNVKNSDRWMILCLSFINSFGIYYCCYLPSALESQLLAQYKWTHAQYNSFFSFFYYSSLPVTIIAGYLCDKVGICKSTTLFLFISMIGQSIIAFGCYLPSTPYILLLSGRFIYGIGCEPYQVANSALIAKYFMNAESFLSMGLKLAFGRLTTAFTYRFGITMFNKIFNQSIQFAMLSGVISMIIAVIAAVIIWLIDNKNKNKSNLEIQIQSTTPSESSNSELSVSDNNDNIINAKNYVYWILLLITGINYTVSQGWLGMSSEYVQKKYYYSDKAANKLIMLITLIPAFFTPAIGFLIDKKPIRCQALLLSSCMMLLAHLSFNYDCSEYGVVSIIVLAIGFSIYPAVCWAAVPLLVDMKHIGKAMGFMTAFLCLLLAGCPSVMGKLQDIAIAEGISPQSKDKYKSSEMLLLWMCGISLVLTMCLWCIDHKYGKRLQQMKSKL